MLTALCKKNRPEGRFFLLFVDEYCADEVSELTNTFLAKDGIGVIAYVLPR